MLSTEIQLLKKKVPTWMENFQGAKEIGDVNISLLIRDHFLAIHSWKEKAV